MRPRLNNPSLLALLEACRQLGEGELSVLEEIAWRLRLGKEAYGSLRPKSDPRNWQREASEELLDGCVYLACESLRRRSRR